MKPKHIAFAEEKFKIIDTYIDWKKNKESGGKSIITARACVEHVLKAEIIRHFNVFSISEFHIQTRNILVKAEKLLILNKRDFSFEDCFDLLNNENLLGNSSIINCFRYIQGPGNNYGHNADVMTRYEVESVNSKLLRILDWFFKNIGVKDWRTTQIEQRLLSLSDEAQKSYDKIKPFDTTKENYNILILPFLNPEKIGEISAAGKNLADRLKENNEKDKLDLDVKYLSIIPTDCEIKEIGKKINADIVIWGNDSKPEGKEPHQIHFHYMNLIEDFEDEYEKIYEKGKTNKIEVGRLIEIAEGNLHLEIDDIIYWFLGTKFYSKKDYKNALLCFQKIKNDNYRNEDLYFDISYCFYYLESYDKTKENLITALKINPQFSDAHFNYAKLLKYKFNNHIAAKKHLKKILKIDPHHTGAYFFYANLLQDEGNWKGEEKNLKKVLEIDPNYAPAFNNYANLLNFKLNDKEKAKKYYEKALEINPRYVDALIGYGALFYMLKDIEKAKIQYKYALMIDPNDDLLNFNYAFVLHCGFNENEIAKKYCEQALKLNPQSVQAHLLYARLLKSQSNVDDNDRITKHYLIATRLNIVQKIKKNFRFLIWYYNYIFYLLEKSSIR